MSDEMHMTLLSVDPPLPLLPRIAILLTLVFIFIGPYMAGRSRRPLIVLTLPFLWCVAALFLGLARVARAMPLFHAARAAVAAGLAEAQMLLVIAFGGMGFVALLLSWRRPEPTGALGWPIPLSIFAFFGAADCWLSFVLLRSTGTRGFELPAAFVFAAIAGVALVAMIVQTIRSRSPEGNSLGRNRALIVAAAFFAIAYSVAKIVGVMERIAIRA